LGAKDKVKQNIGNINSGPRLKTPLLLDKGVGQGGEILLITIRLETDYD